MQRIGIIGAGKLGIVLAQLARKAGYEVRISGSGDVSKIALSVKILAPGAIALTTKEVIEQSDIIILALPLSKFGSLPSEAFKDKLVIDAMNHWWEIDGPREETIPDGVSSSEFVQQQLTGATIVKALSHMGYHELLDYAHHEQRKAIAIASDDAATIETVSKFVDSLGFEPLYIGKLSKGRVLEPGNVGFGVAVSKQALIDTLKS